MKAKIRWWAMHYLRLVPEEALKDVHQCNEELIALIAKRDQEIEELKLLLLATRRQVRTLVEENQGWVAEVAALQSKHGKAN